jgi:hypothetical protein
MSNEECAMKRGGQGKMEGVAIASVGNPGRAMPAAPHGFLWYSGISLELS